LGREVYADVDFLFAKDGKSPSVRPVFLPFEKRSLSTSLFFVTNCLGREVYADVDFLLKF
jgi:hypothetical protein